LIELDGEDLRREPIEIRKQRVFVAPCTSTGPRCNSMNICTVRTAKKYFIMLA
jgi:hypothetical protein